MRAHGRSRPGKLALRADGRELDHAGLDARTNQVANALIAAGVAPGDRVAFLDTNAIEHFLLLFGAAKAGAIYVPLNWRLSPVELATVIEDSGAKVLVVGRALAAVVEGLRHDLAAVERVFVVGSGAEDDFDALCDQEPASDPAVERGSDDIAILYYSSGTTGRPKGVMLTHANLLRHCASTSAAWRHHDDAIVLAAMPLFHVGGGGWSLTGVWQGATVEILRDVTPASAWEALLTRGITHTFFVPAMIRMLLAEPRPPGGALDLEVLVYGASPISDQVLTDAIATFGAVFLQGYGLTEASGSVVHLHPEDHDPFGPRAHLLRSCGRPDPVTELRIADPDDGRELGPGVVGEVQLRGPLTMAGYWQMPEETERAFTPDGWLRTGDAGYVDDDGYLYLHDRMKDMIVSGGENVFPAEVENALMAHPAVADVAVIGVPHDRWGETPIAVVVAADGADRDEPALLEHCRAHLAGYKCPTRVVWIDALPRNAAGKILKKDLRAPYWTGRDRFVS